MRRREIAKIVLGSAAGSALLASSSEAQTCNPPCFPLTQREQAAGVTVVNNSYQPGHVYRYGVNTEPGCTDMTVAIQSALNANLVVELPGEVCLFSTLNWPLHRTIRGKGPRTSILRQRSCDSTAEAAITLTDPGTPAGEPAQACGVPPGGSCQESRPAVRPGWDISDGTYRADGFCVEVAAKTGLLFKGPGPASMFMTDQLRLVSRTVETHVTRPYPTTSNQRGIWFKAGLTAAAFVANHRNLEIRGFDVGIDASGGVNEWKVHGWLLDCRVGVRLHDCSTWNLDALTIESGVANARAIQLIGAVSNLTVDGGRWELTWTGGHGIEGDGSVTGNNIRVRGVNVLIDGDGSSIPGRKWTGVLPDDTIVDGYDTSGPFLIVPNLIATRLPNSITLGGANLGNGKIVLGRNLGGADSTIEHDGTHMVLTGGNSVKLAADGTSSERLEINGQRAIFAGADGADGYQHAIRLGALSHVWVDSVGRLRIKQGVPTMDFDGTTVGSQS